MIATCRVRILRALSFGFALLFAAIIAAASARAAPPNVLLIVADDLGLQLPAYGDHTVAASGIDSSCRSASSTRTTSCTSSLASRKCWSSRRR
jgi:hypothetical protein